MVKLCLLSFLVVCAIDNSLGQLLSAQRLRTFYSALQLRNVILRNQRKQDKVCYDTVGCFEIPYKRSPLQKVPESPQSIDTKFYLFRENIKFSRPELLRYEDKGVSLNQSSFRAEDQVKIIIHGYMGRWNQKGALEAANLYIKICNCNVILVDWEKGARGPQYANAASNTEIVGRQLGILLLHIINKKVKPRHIHLIGFSLGAHIAGCASELLKKRGYLLGRISGLDAASPLFRHNNFRERSKKLDREDALYVDAIHTDASPIFTDGFGLLEPIGHVDFFPNGGFEQPGCYDSSASVVLSHLEGALSREIACSHLRAWQLFLESLRRTASGKRGCDFIAFKCSGGLSAFHKGLCFPQIDAADDPLRLDRNYRTEFGQLGEESSGNGVMYLATRKEAPYCGTQLQGMVQLSHKVSTINGMIDLNLQYHNYTNVLKIQCQIQDSLNTAREMSALIAVEYNSIKNTTKSVTANLIFTSAEYEQNRNTTMLQDVYFDKVILKDMYGNSWTYCGRETQLKETVSLTVTLHKKKC